MQPVSMDAGIISPNNSTAVTDKMMATTSSTTALRNIGKASVADAFLFENGNWILDLCSLFFF